MSLCESTKLLFISVLGASCASRAAVEPPPLPPERPVSRASDAAGSEASVRVLLGELCPAALQRRPAVMPLFLLDKGWKSRSTEVSAVVARREARQFSIASWNGARAGVFSVVGATQVGDRQIAVGSYAGTSPCRERVETSSGWALRDTPECTRTTADCALAVARLEAPGGFAARPFAEDPEPSTVRMGTGCTAKGHLVLDVDGDGRVERFRWGDFFATAGNPRREVSAVRGQSVRCAPKAATSLLALADGAGIRLVAALDVDDDGRFEVIVEYRDRTGIHRWAIYSAAATPARLDLAGSARSWPKQAR